MHIYNLIWLLRQQSTRWSIDAGPPHKSLFFLLLDKVLTLHNDSRCLVLVVMLPLQNMWLWASYRMTAVKESETDKLRRAIAKMDSSETLVALERLCRELRATSRPVIELSDGDDMSQPDVDQTAANDIDRTPQCANCGWNYICSDVDADGVCRRYQTKRLCETSSRDATTVITKGDSVSRSRWNNSWSVATYQGLQHQFDVSVESRRLIVSLTCCTTVILTLSPKFELDRTTRYWVIASFNRIRYVKLWPLTFWPWSHVTWWHSDVRYLYQVWTG